MKLCIKETNKKYKYLNINRNYRRTIIRWVCLGNVMALRLVSYKVLPSSDVFSVFVVVKKVFPSSDFFSFLCLKGFSFI